MIIWVIRTDTSALFNTKTQKAIGVFYFRIIFYDIDKIVVFCLFK